MEWLLLLLLLVISGPGPGKMVRATKERATAEQAIQALQWSNSVQRLQSRHVLQEVPNPCNRTELPGCSACAFDAGVWRCSSCAGSLLLIRATNACGCPAGTYGSEPHSCRDCPKGSFCSGGRYTGVDNSPPVTPCSIYGPGLTTLGVRTTRKEGCVNLPGWSYSVWEPGSLPVATPCPADTYQFGLRKQRACVPCPPGFSTFSKTMQTSIAACDINACIGSPCGKNMDCIDLPKPALGGTSGRNCTCIPGASYVDDIMGCSDPGETPMIGAPDNGRPLLSFESRCPRGAFVVAFSGTADTHVRSIAAVSCSDGSGAPLVGFGLSTDNRFTTVLSPDGFTGMAVTAEDTVKSVTFGRRDNTYSHMYGTLADVATQQGRRQFLTCHNFGVAVGIVGVKTAAGAPVRLGFICSGLPCAVREDAVFGPANAGAMQGPGSYVRDSPSPIQTTTATQCCSTCTHDFRCLFWIRDRNTGNCWLVYRQQSAPGSGVPTNWGFQTANGFQSGATQTKLSGISVSGTYMGCFRDASCVPAQRLKVVLAANSPDMTVKQCLSLALNAGWPYIGLAPGVTPGTTSCFAGDNLPTTAVNPGCLAACAGNSSERCGDVDCQVSIYAVIKPRWPLTLLNTGDNLRGAGWYDIQCQGVVNDFCRWLGRGDDSFYSCAIAGAAVSTTLRGEISENITTSAACQETGYNAQPQTDLTCASGDLSLPWDNNCRTRQCCKAKCDSDPLCTGFVFGNSPMNNCRSPGDGQNCCWLKGGVCKSASQPLTTAWLKSSEPAECTTFPKDPRFAVMFCPNNGNSGSWPQGTRCNAECLYGIQNSDARPFTICQSNGQWSDLTGLCKPPCTLPPLLCP